MTKLLLAVGLAALALEARAQPATSSSNPSADAPAAPADVRDPEAAAAGAGQAAGSVQPGEEQRASIGAAAQPTTRSPSQLREQRHAQRDRRGPYESSILLAPRAFADLDRLSGLRRDEVGGALGIQLDRVLVSPLSLVVGADVGTRGRGPALSSSTLIGLNGGLNLYLLGGDNRGVYVGPRASFAAAGYDARLADTGDRFGFGGEVGFRAVTSGGFTAGVAAGVMNQARGALAFDRAQLAAIPTERRNYGYAAVQLGWSF